LPVTTLVVTVSWPGYWLILIAASPSASHFFERSCRSGTSMVSFWTPIVRPQALSMSTCFGLPLVVTHWMGELK
jgi:hypothetical protein